MEGLLSQMTAFHGGMLVVVLWICTTIGTTFLQMQAFKRPTLIAKTLTFGTFALGAIMLVIIILAGLGV